MPEYRSHDNTSPFATAPFSRVRSNSTRVLPVTISKAHLVITTRVKLRNKDIEESRVKVIGERVLQTDEFRSRYASCGVVGGGESNHRVLLLGDLGSGRPFLFGKDEL